MTPSSYHCPNCSAPLDVAVGETEVCCPFCVSRLRLVPGKDELEVVRVREEMKRRERVEVQRIALEKQLEQQELERWRQTAARVALAAMPIVGQAAGRALFRQALGKAAGGGCGCGCALAIALLGSALAVVLASR
jgi:uncharacterized Zn finger protein (UPF0148 family)